MDSLSQIVLGASMAHVVLGGKLGRRALLLGAVGGTLPDLDVLVPYADAIESFTYHRSWSHSLFVLTLISFPVAWLCKRFIRMADVPYARWWLASWLVLVTHPLLDGFTVYGTQIWWPLDVSPTAWGSVFIIDPIYTLPLVIGVAMAWRRRWSQARPVVVASLLISTGYLGWTLFAQHVTQQRVAATLARSDITASHVLIAPLPFSLLWRVVVVTDEHYLEGYGSLLDSEPQIDLQRYDNGRQSCKQWLALGPVQRMDWFTNGLFALSVRGDQLVLTDLRMGIEGDYVFEFAVAERRDEQWRKMVTLKLPTDIDSGRMMSLLSRMYDESVDLAPPTGSSIVTREECAGEIV